MCVGSNLFLGDGSGPRGALSGSLYVPFTGVVEGLGPAAVDVLSIFSQSPFLNHEPLRNGAFYLHKLIWTSLLNED